LLFSLEQALPDLVLADLVFDAGIAREPGIHNPGRWLWIPGSPHSKSAMADLDILNADLGQARDRWRPGMTAAMIGKK
jgi:hypothetical protein